MPNIKPFRDIDEHDVRNGFYTWSGAIPTTKGTLVKVFSGYSIDAELLDDLGNAGAAYNNTVSQRVGLTTSVCPVAGSGDNVYGMLLYDVRELDEHGLPLKWNTEKQTQMQCTISGQSVVLLKRGLILYSGVNGGAAPVVGVTAGAPAYAAANGCIGTTGSSDPYNPAKVVGQFAGIPNSQGWTLVDLDIR